MNRVVFILLCLICSAKAHEAEPLVVGTARPTITTTVQIPVPESVERYCGGIGHVTVDRGMWACK